MDKKLKRVIGYIPSTTSIRPVVEKKQSEPKRDAITEVLAENKVDISDIPKVVKFKSKQIVNWIEGHKEFKWSAMCKELKIDKSNFQRVIKSDTPEIKIDYIPKIENFLKRYGYAE